MSYRSLEVQLNVVQLSEPAKSSGAGDIGVKEAFAQQKQTEEVALRGSVWAWGMCSAVCVCGECGHVLCVWGGECVHMWCCVCLYMWVRGVCLCGAVSLCVCV